MKIGRQAFVWALLNVFFLIVSATFAGSQEQSGNSRLNGKWEGRPPAGGELQMTLRVEKDNQVRGTSLIPTGARRGAKPQVTGTVNGDQVTLETFFPGAFPQEKVTYNCKLTEGALQCRTKGSYKTTFKKID